MTTPQTPAGWYPDPDGSGGHRYWDGQVWTEHRAPAPTPPPPPPPPPPVEPERVGSHRAPDPEPEPVPAASSAPTAVIPTLPPPPPGPPPADPTPYAQPEDATRSLLVRYLAACAALFAVLIGVVIYAVVSAGSGNVTISTADGPTTQTTERTAPTETTATETTATETVPPPLDGGGIDGAMEFSVSSAEFRPTVTSTDAPIEKAATGMYIVVYLTVTNISDAPTTFLGTFQKLKADGTVFSIDDEATFYAGGGIAELNPGDSVDVGLAFDVPPGTVPEAVELHADPMSAGVELPLVP